VDSDVDQQVCYNSHTEGVLHYAKQQKLIKQKEETKKEKQKKKKKKKKRNLIKLKETIQVERKRQSAAKSDPDKIFNIL